MTATLSPCVDTRGLAPRSGHRFAVLATLVATSVLGAAASAQVVVTDPGQGTWPLEGGPAGALELSGLVHDQGARWLAISDQTAGGASAYEITIALDAAGRIESAEVEAALPLSAGRDLEGITVGDGTLFVADEAGPTLHRFHPADGSVLGEVPVPVIFSTARPNRSLESLTRSGDGSMWTANEEALQVDGPVSTFTEGTLIRLQRFDIAPPGRTLSPQGQWAYRTDPLPGDVLGSSPGRDVEASGVSDLVVLGDGTLIALERATGGDPMNFDLPITRARLYEIHFGGASDISTLAGLEGESFTAVGKTLLWERTFAVDFAHLPLNFEGIGLGPRLSDGSHALLLISDDGGGARQALYALNVRLDHILVFADGFEGGTLERWTG